VLVRVFAMTLALIAVAPAHAASADDHVAVAIAPMTPAAATPDPPPPDTINEFFPEQRSLGDCLSSLPKPDCGSSARGGWRQTVVLVAILAGLGFIAWRIVAQSKKARS
jgi:hypothetical protein